MDTSVAASPPYQLHGVIVRNMQSNTSDGDKVGVDSPSSLLARLQGENEEPLNTRLIDYRINELVQSVHKHMNVFESSGMLLEDTSEDLKGNSSAFAQHQSVLVQFQPVS